MGSVVQNRITWLALLGVLIGPLPALSQGPFATPGNYSCFVANSVGLRFGDKTIAVKITYPDNKKKFFVTIAENKQLPEDKCLGTSAVDDLKKLRRSDVRNLRNFTAQAYFFSDSSYYEECQAQYTLKF